MGVVRLKGQKTIDNRKTAIATKAVDAEPKAVTLSELKVIADLIKSGAPCYLFNSTKVTLDGTKLTVGWADVHPIDKAKTNPLDLLWDVTGLPTKTPSVTAIGEGYSVIVRPNNNGVQSVMFFKKPSKPTTMGHENKLSVIEKVNWINEGKPCAYRYGFEFKGAKAHRITTGEAKERFAKKKYFEVDLEHTRVGDVSGDYLVFCEYSAADME
jgi:hypothetical protein